MFAKLATKIKLSSAGPTSSMSVSSSLDITPPKTPPSGSSTSADHQDDGRTASTPGSTVPSTTTTPSALHRYHRPTIFHRSRSALVPCDDPPLLGSTEAGTTGDGDNGAQTNILLVRPGPAETEADDHRRQSLKLNDRRAQHAGSERHRAISTPERPGRHHRQPPPPPPLPLSLPRLKVQQPSPSSPRTIHSLIPSSLSQFLPSPPQTPPPPRPPASARSARFGDIPSPAQLTPRRSSIMGLITPPATHRERQESETDAQRAMLHNPPGSRGSSTPSVGGLSSLTRIDKGVIIDPDHRSYSQPHSSRLLLNPGDVAGPGAEEGSGRLSSPETAPNRRASGGADSSLTGSSSSAWACHSTDSGGHQTQPNSTSSPPSSSEESTRIGQEHGGVECKTSGQNRPKPTTKPTTWSSPRTTRTTVSPTNSIGSPISTTTNNEERVRYSISSISPTHSLSSPQNQTQPQISHNGRIPPSSTHTHSNNHHHPSLFANGHTSNPRKSKSKSRLCPRNLTNGSGGITSALALSGASLVCPPASITTLNRSTLSSISPMSLSATTTATSAANRANSLHPSKSASQLSKLSSHFEPLQPPALASRHPQSSISSLYEDSDSVSPHNELLTLPNHSTLSTASADQNWLKELDDHLVGTGYAVASRKRNQDFHSIFKSIPDDDYLIEDYGCALQRDILIQGRLYVSEQHLCFNANLFGWITNLVVPFSDVITIEKRMTALIIPNAIQVITMHTRHTFASFLSRDSAFDFISSIWRISHPSIPSNPNQSLPSNEDPQHQRSESSSSSDPDGEQLGHPSEVIESDFYQEPRKEIHRVTNCRCGDQLDDHYRDVVLDSIFDADPSQVFRCLCQSDFLNRFWTQSQLLTDIEVSDWTTTDTKFPTRTVSYIKPLNGAVGPKSTKCHIKEEIISQNLEEFVTIISTTRTPDVPAGSGFSVATKTCISWAENNQTRVVITTAVEWSKVNRFLKSIIESSALGGQRTYHQDLEQALKAHIEENMAGPMGVKGAPRPVQIESGPPQQNVHKMPKNDKIESPKKPALLTTSTSTPTITKKSMDVNKKTREEVKIIEQLEKVAMNILKGLSVQMIVSIGLVFVLIILNLVYIRRGTNGLKLVERPQVTHTNHDINSEISETVKESLREWFEEHSKLVTSSSSSTFDLKRKSGIEHGDTIFNKDQKELEVGIKKVMIASEYGDEIKEIEQILTSIENRIEQIRMSYRR